MKNERSILENDFSVMSEEQRLWSEKRKKKGIVYLSLSEYAMFLESMLVSIDDDFEKWLIERELKNLKKLQEEFYVPAILEMNLDSLSKDEEVSKNSSKKASFSLVKRIRKK